MQENRTQSPDCFPLLPLQEGFLFHHISGEPGSDVQQIVMELPEVIDEDAFEGAWQRILAEHAVLRTRFVWEGVEAPRQVIESAAAIRLQRFDWRELAGQEQERRARAFLLADRRAGFDLSRAPAMRIALFRLGGAAYRAVWSFHHILIDGRSFARTITDVFAVYEELRGGPAAAIAPYPPFRDFVERIAALDPAGAEPFWRARLEGFDRLSALPDDPESVAPAEHEENYELIETRFSLEESALLRSFAEGQGVSLNTFLQAAWGLVLSRYTGERDVLFGAAKSHRRSTDDTVGMFLNTLPVRVRFGDSTTAAELVRDLLSQWRSLRAYEYAALADIKRWSGLGADQALFDTLFMYDNAYWAERLQSQGGPWAVRTFRLHGQTNFPLTLIAYGSPEILLQLDADRRRFGRAASERLLGHLRRLALALAADPSAPVAGLDMLTAAERRQILVDWNATGAPSPDCCVHQLVEEQARRRPGAVAVVWNGTETTYGELNQRANRLARRLRAQGVGPDAPVGVSIDRSLDMVVALLAILKAGGAYLPLDPAFPAERLSYMASDAAIPVLLTQSEYRTRWEGHGWQTLCLDAEPLAGESPDDLDPAARPGDLAYILYTSGSTGRPKGVAIEHRALVNLLRSIQAEPGFTERDSMLAVSTISFDIATAELFTPLISGGRIVVASREAAADGEELKRLLASSGATVMDATPVTWRMLIETGWTGTPGLRVFCTGEALPADLAAQLVRRSPEVWNLYGPTETTIWSAIWRVRSAAPVLIGRPVANTEMYILDERSQPTPVGVSGELYLGGRGLARGYLNRPELTAERFIAHPFQAGARLYRTGDLARYRANGEIECLGRIDHQVKIRGFRIELEEIEAALKEHPAVRQAVVIAREDTPGDKRLAAYLILRGPCQERELRESLERKLPAYMVPPTFTVLESLPLTGSGKVNRRALPAPASAARDAGERGPEPPRTRLERQLHEIWSELLRSGDFGIRDSFFELGGHSLLAVRLFARIAERCGVKLSLNTLFNAPTIEKLARAIESAPAERAGGHGIVQIQGGRGPALFWVPGGAAVSALAYREASRLAWNEQPVYALESDILEAGKLTVEELAEVYLHQIRSVQKSGPYHLAGFCLGARVAFEAARRLVEAGEPAGLVAIVNAAAPGWPRSAAEAARIRRQRMRRQLARAARSGPGALARLVVNRLAAEIHVRREQRRVDAEEAVLASSDGKVLGLSEELALRLSMRTMKRYQPKPYPGRIEIFACEEEPAYAGVDASLDARLGWRELAGSAGVHYIPGQHVSVLERPHVVRFAEVLRACLNDAGARAEAFSLQ